VLSEQEVFIENMKYYRNLNSISQQKLAELCNVSVGTIGNIESFISKPSFDMIINISRQLHVSPDCLFRDRNNNGDNSFLYEIQKKKIIELINTQLSTQINGSLKNCVSKVKEILDIEKFTFQSLHS